MRSQILSRFPGVQRARAVMQRVRPLQALGGVVQPATAAWAPSITRAGILALCVLGTGGSQAGGADAGPTVPIAVYLAERMPDTANTELAADLAISFPVKSKGMRPGTLKSPTSLAPAHARLMTQPLAIVGDDTASQAWLTRYSTELARIGAAVLVIDVASAQRMVALRQAYPDLPMAAASLQGWIPALRASNALVYPLLVGADGSVRQGLEVAR